MNKVLAITLDPDLCETQTLIGLHKAGVGIKVLLHKTHKRGLLEQAGIECSEIQLTSRFSLKAISKIQSEMQTEDYKIVHCFNNRALTNAIWALSSHKAFLLTYRGTMGHLSRWSPLSHLSYLHPKVDKIICVSNAVKNYMSNLVRPEKLLRIYKGHDVKWYQQESKFDLKTLNVPDNVFMIGCVANLRPVKGVSYLIEAVKLLNNYPIHILLVGRVEDRAVKKLLLDPLLKGRLHAIGFREDATAIIAACDIAVTPSVEREGLSKSTAEAMAQGIAPIVTNVGGLPELVIDGESGLVVPERNPDMLAQAILKLYKNPDLKKKLGENAKERIKIHFSIERTVAEYYALYQGLFNKE